MMRIGRQWDERLKMWDEAFERNLYIQLGEVELMGFTTMEQVEAEEQQKQAEQNNKKSYDVEELERMSFFDLPEDL